MLIVFIATLVGYRIKQIMLENRMDIRLIFFCSAFFPSVIAASGHLFSLGLPDYSGCLSLFQAILFLKDESRNEKQSLFRRNNESKRKPGWCM